MAKVPKAKVLLLEDDQDLSELIQDYFNPRGYTFIAHSSAEKGLDEITKQATSLEPIELVITDFRLPNMNGIKLIERLKQVAPEIPILLMTAHSSLDLAVEAIQMGAYDFVIKPIQFAQLSMSMERALHFGKLKSENKKLKSLLENPPGRPDRIIAKSAVMRSIVDLAKRVAKSDATLLISGESGTGKEVLAQLIHASSNRADKSFIAINCSAIPETLLESELFGHAKGSFTGAEQKKIGLFEEANEGTLFLDEIGDLSLPLQAKLLRVIQERKIKRVGENQYRNINIRLLTATHKNLAEEVKSLRFREDLFFRLNVIPIRIPPLRSRKEDILPLAEHFFKVFTARSDAKISGFSKNALHFMLKNEWPGNVRELENSVERAVVLCGSTWIEESHFLLPTENLLPTTERSIEADRVQIEEILKGHSHTEENEIEITTRVSDTMPAPQMTSASVPLLAVGELIPLAALESRYIQYVLSQVGSVKERASKILDVDRKTLYRKLAALESPRSEELTGLSISSH